MPKSKDSPLKRTQREADSLQKEVKKHLDECNKHLLKKTPDRNKENRLYGKTQDLTADVEPCLNTAQKLKSENEPVPVTNFEEKKNDDVKRLQRMMNDLLAMEKKLAPDEVEQGYYEKIKKGEISIDSEDESVDDEDVEEEEEVEEEESEEEYEEEGEEEEYEEEGEEEEYDEEEEDEEEEEEEEESELEERDDESEVEGAVAVSGETGQLYEALEDYSGDQAGDLNIAKGDILTIIRCRDDGWWEAENDDGERGLVPVTYLKVHNKYKGVPMKEDDLSGEEEEDGEEGKTPRSARNLWKSIQKAVKETSVTDVLQAMGAVPAGFRESTLVRLGQQKEYSIQNYLAPNLSPSCVSYKDLFFDATTDRIRARTVKVQRIVSIVNCQQIPNPGTAEHEDLHAKTGVEIKCRQIRACLFDGQNMLSNIHTMRVSGLDKEQRTWQFNTRASENMKSVEFGDFFVRTNSTESKLGILFELCMSYERSSTNQAGEFACGWAHLELFDNEGKPVPNKTIELPVHGGTPFEKGVDVDPSVGRREKTSLFRSLMSSGKQPKLVVKLFGPTKEQKDYLDTLPDVLISSTAYIMYISLYRQLLCDTLLRDCLDIQSTELVHNPVLSSFPNILEQPDLVDILRMAWSEKLKAAKRAEKKDVESLKTFFVKTYMEIIYPLCCTASLPPFKVNPDESQQQRQNELQRLLQVIKQRKDVPAATFLSPEVMHKPFDMSELAFNIVGHYSTIPDNVRIH